MKTIAYLTPLYFGDESYVGGGERYPQNTAVGVAETGEFAVEILSFGKKAFRRQLHPGVTLQVMKAGYTPVAELDNLSWELPDAVADADLLHIHQAYTRGSEIGYLLARLHGKPICLTDHGGGSSTLGREFGALHLADRVIAYSAFGASQHRGAVPVEIIRGGVDAQAFRPPANRPARDRVMFVGRLLPHKGVDQLIRALPAGLPLTCVGQPYHPAYFELIQGLAAGKNVEFVTDAGDDRVRDLYGRAWANVLPSVYRDCYGNTHDQPELMGFTLLESMACGTPVVCPRVGAMPEFVRHGETGFVYDTPEELTGYLAALAGDPALVERMGARAREVVVAEFDLRVVGRRLAAIYRELLGGSAATGRAA